MTLSFSLTETHSFSIVRFDPLAELDGVTDDKGNNEGVIHIRYGLIISYIYFFLISSPFFPIFFPYFYFLSCQ